MSISSDAKGIETEPCYPRASCCAIIPPHMLEHIANAADASDETTHRILAEGTRVTKNFLNQIASVPVPPNRGLRTPSQGPPESTSAAASGVGFTAGGEPKSSNLLTAGAGKAQTDVLKLTAAMTSSVGNVKRAVHDNRNLPQRYLPGTPARREGQPAVSDMAVNAAYDNLGILWSFFAAVFKLNSVGNKGLPLLATVHVDRSLANAFWSFEKNQMVFGDGNSLLYQFPNALDVVAHEITHGIISFSCGLKYENQSGALNESLCDCFAAMAEQWYAQMKSLNADWLAGEGIIRPGVKGVALRSLKEPGTAYNDPVMKDYVRKPNTREGDWGGVHTNSGIPNQAFYRLCYLVMGYSWENPGYIWYTSMLQLSSTATFKEFADLTMKTAAKIGFDDVVKDAWEFVGVYQAT